MSTAEAKAYFGDYGPRFVEWINDSSCAWHGWVGGTPGSLTAFDRVVGLHITAGTDRWCDNSVPGPSIGAVRCAASTWMDDGVCVSTCQGDTVDRVCVAPTHTSNQHASHATLARPPPPTGCVLFADAASAARAIVGTGHPLPPDQQAPDAGGQAGALSGRIRTLPAWLPGLGTLQPVGLLGPLRWLGTGLGGTLRPPWPHASL